MGLWNLNDFPLQPSRLFDNLRNGALYNLLNSEITKKSLSGLISQGQDNRTRLEILVEKFGADSRNFAERIVKDRETIIPYIVLRHICRLFAVEKEKLPEYVQKPIIRRTILNVVETVVRNGVSSPMIFAQPLMVVWNITGRCNLRCKHCYQDAGILSKGLPEELKNEEKLLVMEEIAKTNIPTFAFAGGEPLADPLFWELAQIGKRAGLYMSINTNGTLITDKVAQKLKEIGFAYYGISLDAARPEIHDTFRGVNGSFQRALAGIRNLISAGEGDKVCISYTVARENSIVHNQIPEMMKLRDALGIRKVVLYNYIPCGRASFGNDLTADEREKLFELFYDDLKDGKETLLSTAPQFGRYCKQMYEKGAGNYAVIGHFSSGNIEKLKNLVELIGGCGAARAYIALQPDGIITPCVFMPNCAIGNIKVNGKIDRNNLLDVWNSSEVLKTIRDRRKHSENCGCNGKYFSVCGGCAARSYAYFGNFSAPDPGCIMNKELVEKWNSGTCGKIKEKEHIESVRSEI